MSVVKLAVVYDSKTGNTKQAAEWIAEGMNEVKGVESRTFRIDAVDNEYLKDAAGMIAGCPAYTAMLTPDMRTWLLQIGEKIDLSGKLGGAFSTEQYTHGGGELVIQSILTAEMVCGMLTYSGGRALGRPVIHLGPVGVNNNVEEHNNLEYYKETFMIFGERFAWKAMELFANE